MSTRYVLVSCAVLLLAGCEIPGVYPDPKVVAREADAKATGGACRHALRGIEDCYTLNPKASKASVFAGWKEMDTYMRENKIEGVASVVKIPVATPPGGEEAVATTKEEAPPAKAKEAHGSKAKSS
jgi:alpha-beta hydrolase superfamily lysophospholipase